MSEQPKLYLNLYWHMHQPDYRDTTTGEYVLPWTYLHAIKDYTDMAHHLETNPGARVTFNFVPVLLDQLEDYRMQFESGDIRDPLLALLIQPRLADITQEQCLLIIDSCFKNYHEKMLAPFEHYQKLHNIFSAVEAQYDAAFSYLSAQYKADLLVWYHLAWTGESVRRDNALVQRLFKQGSGFSLDDRLALFRLIGELITGLIPRYKQLCESGRIEISTTPYYHPILPLLLDFDAARDAMPEAPLPQNARYPGGRVRAQAHIEQAQESHVRRFGQQPAGMWPAEGGVSHAGLSLMAQHGVQWAATGEGVLANSLRKSHGDASLPSRQEFLYQPYRITDGEHDIICFFRDDQLSDKIGFEYSKFHASDAVADFIDALELIHAGNAGPHPAVVSVILDGENAWEYYPYNGYYFLAELYATLAAHPHIEMKTCSDIVQLAQQGGVNLPTLPAVAAGSWVYGSFSTWIGSPEKNLGWDLLCEAKKAYDRVMQTETLDEHERLACERQLAVCEGSDWFWWFGDFNSAVSVDSFDRLYRRNLTNLYKLLRQPVPESLSQSISVGAGEPDVGGTMRRGQEA